MSGFVQALDFISRPDIEGGVSDHPDDRGGLTVAGVTQGLYDHWRKLHNLAPRPVTDSTEEERTAAYHELFWVKAHCDGWWWPLSLAVFDAAVQHSPPRAIKLLQAAAGITGDDVDGIVGPQTRGAVARTQRLPLLARLRWERLRYYARIVKRRESQSVFLVGWVNRMQKLDRRLAEDVGLAA